jgi:hypothetical protein
MSKLRKKIRKEIERILVGLATTLLAMLIIAFWRQFDTETFIFLQISAVSILIAILCYALSESKYLSRFLHHNELVVALIPFILVSFLLLNIDRSRSIHLLKWVGSNQNSGTTLEQLRTVKNLTPSEFSAIQQRISEQEQSGTIVENKSKIQLSYWGQCMLKIIEAVARFENLTGYFKA